MTDTVENPGTQETVVTQAPEVKVEAPITPEVKTEEVKATPAWPENWRDLIAGGDLKERERLDRFSEVPQIFKSFRQLEAKVSSAKFKPELPENPTPEQLTEYRKAIGVPEKPEGYFEKLDNLVIGEEDKPAMELFANRLHEMNTPPEVFNKVMETAFELIEQNQQEAIQAQMEIKEASRQKLYETWGPADYKVNINAIANWLTSMPESLRSRVEGAQLADGTLMFNDAEYMQWAAQHVREMNPALGVMPAGTGDVVASIDAKLAENRKMMATPSLWFAKENSERRAEHTKLLETRMKYEGR